MPLNYSPLNYFEIYAYNIFIVPIISKWYLLNTKMLYQYVEVILVTNYTLINLSERLLVAT